MIPVRNNYDQNWLPSIFNELFEDERPTSKKNSTVPAINVLEDNIEYKIEVAAPGMTKEDFKISLIDEDYITIYLEKKSDEENKSRKYLRREFAFSKFEQTLALPEDVDRSKISAQMLNGILTIHLNKVNKQDKNNKPIMIEIK